MRRAGPPPPLAPVYTASWAHDSKVTDLFRRAAYRHIAPSPFLRPLPGLKLRLLGRRLQHSLTSLTADRHSRLHTPGRRPCFVKRAHVTSQSARPGRLFTHRGAQHNAHVAADTAHHRPLSRWWSTPTLPHPRGDERMMPRPRRNRSSTPMPPFACSRATSKIAGCTCRICSPPREVTEVRKERRAHQATAAHRTTYKHAMLFHARMTIYNQQMRNHHDLLP